MSADEASQLPVRRAGATQLSGWRIALSATAVVCILFAVYWFFIRESYEPLLTAAEAGDAAEVVKLLDERKIPYQLDSDGQTVRVPSEQLGKARLEVIGSELPMRGQVGFELFNQSDMGITEFAQKINYQRALQGELARTILLLDGVKAVRVHLGLPEQTLFRDGQSQPKASVTLILNPGAVLTEGRVVGIQRLVAGAIPDMTSDAVAVLDGSGRVISQSVAPVAQGAVDTVLTDYRRRAIDAISAAVPELRFSVQVSFRMQTVQARNDQAPPERDPLFVAITAPTTLTNDERERVAQSLAVSAGISPKRGDSISYVVGEPVGASIPMARTSTGTEAPDRIVSEQPATTKTSATNRAISPWWLLLPVAAIALVIAWLRDRRRHIGPDSKRLEDFAAVLKQRLALEEGGRP